MPEPIHVERGVRCVLGTILVIDDNEDILELLELILCRRGYQVRAASSGQEGLSILREGVLPEVILLDVEMPDMRGTEFLDHLERQRPEAFGGSSIIFYSAGEFLDDPRVHGYLSKMTDLNETVGLVGDLMSRRLVNVPLPGS